jgi:hypothetical protein
MARQEVFVGTQQSSGPGNFRNPCITPARDVRSADRRERTNETRYRRIVASVRLVVSAARRRCKNGPIPLTYIALLPRCQQRTRILKLLNVCAVGTRVQR